MTAELSRSGRSLDELKGIVSAGLTSFVEVGRALAEIRDRKLYRETHKTFEAFCSDEWGMNKRYANRLICGSDIVEAMGPMGPVPQTERQARPLTRVPLDEQAEVWRQAVDTAPGGKVTAKHVASVVDAHVGATRETRTTEREVLPSMVLDPACTELLRQQIGGAFNVWRDIQSHSSTGRLAVFVIDGGVDALAILGLSWDADSQAVRRAYRDAACVYHPDKGGAPEDWNRLQWAHDLVTRWLATREVAA